jgi:elongation factor P
LKIVETDPGVRGDTSGGGGQAGEAGNRRRRARTAVRAAQDEVIKVDTLRANTSRASSKPM